ncbi:regucalcin-like [Belonocnema kinseyi]|uniref:regucalcin-like n=1 Tax=Belonocnema kinseyi TaxID=2817044 RepID=UPI00143D0D68|nr:regucalcin-like [Belonocnema kinseyi]
MRNIKTIASTIKVGEPVSGKLWSYHPLSPSAHLIEYELEQNEVSNGIVWHLRDPTILYCIDGMNNRIISFAYNVVTRTITGYIGIAFDLQFWNSNQQHPLYTGHAMLGRMTIDTKGRIWVPLYEGSHVLQIDPLNRAVLQAIHIPAARVSACVFGGASKNILYVSTLGYNNPKDRPAGDQGGKIFAVTKLGNDVMGHWAKAFDVPKGYV